MKAVLLAAALLAAGTAMADDMVASDPTVGVVLRLKEAPCASPDLAVVLAIVNPEPAKAAEVHWRGQDRVGCWVTVPDQPLVAVVDEAGGNGVLPLQSFKRAPSI